MQPSHDGSGYGRPVDGKLRRRPAPEQDEHAPKVG
jgi:hypothetical protein